MKTSYTIIVLFRPNKYLFVRRSFLDKVELVYVAVISCRVFASVWIPKCSDGLYYLKFCSQCKIFDFGYIFGKMLELVRRRLFSIIIGPVNFFE